MTVGDGDGEGEGEGRGGWGGRWRQHGTGQMRGPRADLGLEAWCGVRAVRGHASEWVGGQENGGADDCARVICTRPRWDNKGQRGRGGVPRDPLDALHASDERAKRSRAGAA